MFRGSEYWRLTSDSVASGYPRSTSADWEGLPAGLDAGFTWPETSATYIFKVEKFDAR